MQIKHSTVSILKFLKQWALPCVLVLFVLILQAFPAVVESVYSTYVYVKIAVVLRTITAWLPISIGDIFYAVLCIQLCWLIGCFFYKLFNRKVEKKNVFIFLGKLVRTTLWVYIIFNVLWGLNYTRLGIAHQLKLQKNTYTEAEVKDVLCSLIDRVNTLRKQIGKDRLPSPTFNEIFEESAQLYKTIDTLYPFLAYKNPSIKKSLFSKVSHYIGFTGYYNPFSGEAQLSTNIPRIIVPYVACHEIAHQLGYASEDEANFVGYLACSRSSNLYFQYSVYLDLYKYAAMELLMMNIEEKNGWQLDSLVRKDLRDIRKFFNKQSNDISPVMSQIYGQYLKANQQDRGLESYNDVVGLLIAYKKKFRKI